MRIMRIMRRRCGTDRKGRGVTRHQKPRGSQNCAHHQVFYFSEKRGLLTPQPNATNGRDPLTPRHQSHDITCWVVRAISERRCLCYWTCFARLVYRARGEVREPRAPTQGTSRATGNKGQPKSSCPRSVVTLGEGEGFQNVNREAASSDLNVVPLI